MSNSLIRDAVILSAFSVGVCVLWINRHTIYHELGFLPESEGSETVLEDENKTLANKFNFFSRSNNDEMVKDKAQISTNKPLGSVVTIQKNPRDGQFWTDAQVNSGIVHFLIDTGASSVALTLDDARKAGIRERDLVYNIPISTAGGRNTAAAIKIKTLAVGAITLRDVDAIVVPKGLHVSLLGMTYLGELQKVEASQNTLTLRF